MPRPECWPGELPPAWSSCVENLKKCVVDADRPEGGAGIAGTILESHLGRVNFPSPRSNTPCHMAAPVCFVEQVSTDSYLLCILHGA